MPYSAYDKIARHGAAIDRLISEMIDEHKRYEEHGGRRPDYLSKLAYEAADFVHAFLLVTQNRDAVIAARNDDAQLRKGMAEGVLEAMKDWGVTPENFRVRQTVMSLEQEDMEEWSDEEDSAAS